MLTRRTILGFSGAVAALSLLPAQGAFAAEALPTLPPKGVWPVTFEDVAGRSVTLARAPQRIIVGNYIANFLLVGGRGALAKVVGMTKDHWESTRTGEYHVFTRGFPELLTIPSIGGFHDDILNIERILSLKPEVLLINRSQFAANNARVDVLERSGIRVVVIDYHAMKLENHVRSTRIIGRMLERDDVAEALCTECIEGLRGVDERVAKIPDAQKHRTAYMELGNLGPTQYGNTYNGTILWGAIMKRIGAASIAENLREPYGALTREFVISRRPEVIIIGGSLWSNNSADQMKMGFTVPREEALKCLLAFKARPLWQSLPAVKTNDFHAVDHGSLRSIIDWHFTLFFAKIFYPEHFRDAEPEAQILATYRKYLPEIDPQGTFTLSLKKL